MVRVEEGQPLDFRGLVNTSMFSSLPFFPPINAALKDVGNTVPSFHSHNSYNRNDSRKSASLGPRHTGNIPFPFFPRGGSHLREIHGKSYPPVCLQVIRLRSMILITVT